LERERERVNVVIITIIIRPFMAYHQKKEKEDRKKEILMGPFSLKKRDDNLKV
jgi:hypothetical protein